MSYHALKLLHLLGIFLLFSGLGGLTLRQLSARQQGAQAAADTASKLAGMTHGMALILLLISGFAMLPMVAQGVPVWALLKVVLWLVFGGLVVVVRKAPRLAGLLWWGLPLLGAVMGYLALFKPGA